MTNNKVALVTGANKGIGHQIAKELVGLGFTVLIGSRNISKGEEAANKIGSGAHALQLDVKVQASINAAAARIRSDFGRLDVLVNNAGVSHAGKAGEGFPKNAMATSMLTDAPMEDIRSIWETNVFGMIAVTQAMLPLLREASAGRIVNMGSTGGSLTWNSNPNNPHRVMYGNYSVSKSAAHAVSLAFAFALEGEGIKVNTACPGHTATALNNFSGARTVEDGARQAVRFAMLGDDGPTGTFADEDGPVAW
jgi:NAD(P)-dependent dehydrogenase (short-subunit alcohol dehydrogenase family)